MAEVPGTTNGDDNIKGNAQGQSDTIQGGRGNDTLSGFSGNDYLGGGRGNDVLIGGAGSDVMSGGLDKDEFQFSAGHIENGTIDWIVDHSFNQGDTITFKASSGGQTIEILSATATFVDNTTFSGFDLSNSANGRELILEVRNTVTNAVEKIVLIDAYSNGNAAQWASALSVLGYNGPINANLDHVTL